MLLTLLMKSIMKNNKFGHLLNEEGRQRRDRNLTRKSLHDPKNSAWERCCGSGDDGSLITIAGFDHSTFACVLGLFKPLFDTHTPWCSEQGGVDGRQCRQLKASETRGKKRDATAAACPGLTLCWHRFRGAEFVLQGWFGFTGTQCNVWLRFGRRTLLRGLSACTECLDNVHCFADGLKPPFEACSGLLEQGMCHNGWTHGHCITICLCLHRMVPQLIVHLMCLDQHTTLKWLTGDVVVTD